MLSSRTKVLIAFFVFIGAVRITWGATQFFTDRGAWETAVTAQGLAVTNFPFTPSNLALSNELVAPPSQNVLFGPVLTFPAASTGFSFSFTVQSFEPNTSMMSWSTYGPDNLAIDSTTPFPFDDGRDAWEMHLTGASVVAFGFDIIDNDFNLNDAEMMEVNGCGGLLGSASLPGSPPGSPVTDARFIGVITDSPILRVFVSEDSVDPDNTGMKGFAFATSSAPLTCPTVSEWGLIAMGLLTVTAGTILVMRRRTSHA